ncbi:MAG: hypothetical protein IPK71_15965 [Myxococcales bacterium]|nr:hypothetical protein [Myxococcales bacterium]
MKLSRVLPIALTAILLACNTPAPSQHDAAPAPTASAAASTATATPSAPSEPPPKTGKTVDTPAGTAAEVGTEVKLAGKTLYPPADCPAGGKDGCAKVKALRDSNEGVKILRHFDGPGGARSILLLQVMPAGNACNGGSLFFVRLAGNAPPQFSDVFDHCGGPDPMVGAMADKIVVSVPAHPPNRGTGTIAAKSMEYDIATGVLAAAGDKGGKKKGAH